MKIVVIGGSGLIGSKLVIKLRQLGHDVTPASPASGVNTLTGEGLREALKGAEIVVDVANSPSFEDAAVLNFFETSGRNLLAEEAIAGVKHHIALSVVGTDRLQGSGYFRAKQAQEDLIKQAAIPYTILHSTQFFEFVGSIAKSGTADGNIHISPAQVQPIASDDVVAAMAELTIGNPLNSTVEVAGPEKMQLDTLVRKYLTVMQHKQTVITDIKAPYYGVLLNDQSLTPGDHARIGTIHYEDWISQPANQR